MHLFIDRRRLQHVLTLLVMLLLIALIFYSALTGDFIFDDYPIFAENPAVHISHWQWQSWLGLWKASHASIQRPLAMLSYALNYVSGATTWGFKATNLTIHLLNAVLVYLLSCRLLSAAKANDNTDDVYRTDYWALAITLIWAIHPLHVSAVMYVVQRMELMGFAFVLLALLAYWRARQRQLAAQRSWPWLLLCALITLTGYFAKETALLVPGYALLLELTVLRFRAARPDIQRAWKLAYALGCLAVIIVFFGYLLPHYDTGAAFSQRDFTAWQRVLTQLRVLPMYLRWSFLPILSQLHFYYDNYPASTGLFHPVTTLLGGLFLLALLVVAVQARHRRPLLALGIGWFFMANVLTSGPIALELVFEHRNYPALFGVVLAAADMLWIVTRRLDSRFPALIAAVVVINFGFLTVLRATTWGNPFLLAQTLVEINPGSGRAAFDLARRYVTMAGDNPDKPFYSLGIRELERGARLPGSSILLEQALLVQAANHPGFLVSQPWWNSLHEKLRTRPIDTETYSALYGLLQARLGASPRIDAQQLADAFEITIARHPEQVTLYAQYADLASLALHNPQLAAAQWRHAVATQDSPSYAIQIAGYLVENHRDREALAVIAEAQDIEPQLRGNTALKDLQGQAQKGLTEATNAIPKS